MIKEFHLNPTDEADKKIEGKIGIAVSQYNDSITKKILAGAQATLLAADIAEDDIQIAWVPGAWELPLAVKWFVEQKDFVAVIALGAVIKGETTHDQHINRAVSLQLMNLTVSSSKPIAFGLLTVNTLDQAFQRAGGTVGNKGEEAASAVISMLRLNNQMSSEAKHAKKFGF